MTLTWRREDYGYAAATLAAAIFLAYLIAGNFGLVPSPLAAGRTGALPQPDVAILAAGRPAIPTVPVAPIAPGPRTHREDANRPPKAPLGLPSIVMTTTSGTKVSIADPGVVTGTATAPARVKNIVVKFMPSSGAAAEVTAALRCDAGEHGCSWTAEIPSVAGVFTVTGTVTDRANRTATSKPIDITVVNPGSLVGGATHTINDVVDGVPRTIEQVASAVDNLLGLLHL